MAHRTPLSKTKAAFCDCTASSSQVALRRPHTRSNSVFFAASRPANRLLDDLCMQNSRAQRACARELVPSSEGNIRVHVLNNILFPSTKMRFYAPGAFPRGKRLYARSLVERGGYSRPLPMAKITHAQLLLWLCSRELPTWEVPSNEVGYMLRYMNGVFAAWSRVGGYLFFLCGTGSDVQVWRC